MRKLARVAIIDSILSIPGADKIEVAIIGGWEVVIPVNTFHPGEKVVFFEIDSFLPVEDRYEFLRKSSYKKLEMEDETGFLKEIEGFRLKTVKLRGQMSQGLIMPLMSYDNFNLSEYPEGSDITNLIGVKLYEPPVPKDMRGKFIGHLPHFIKKTEQERLQNIVNFDEYDGLILECTEKANGTSETIASLDDHVHVYNRNYELSRDENNPYWSIVNDTNIGEILNEFKNIALQGELVGPKISGNVLRLPSLKFYLFNIWDIDKQRHLLPDERIKIWDTIHDKLDDKGKDIIHHIPIIGNVFVGSSPKSGDLYHVPSLRDRKILIDLAQGKSKINPNVEREGIVLKSTTLVKGQSLSFKVLSNLNLLNEK